MILAVTDAHGRFTYINARRPGSIGDAAAYHSSSLRAKINSRQWLHLQEGRHHHGRINGTYVRPHLVADSAFPPEVTMMKCFKDTPNMHPRQKTFNHRLIRTRVVEQAFGRLKGRFRVLEHNSIRDPDYAAQIAVVCCGLHNILDRWQCAGSR